MKYIRTCLALAFLVAGSLLLASCEALQLTDTRPPLTTVDGRPTRVWQAKDRVPPGTPKGYVEFYMGPEVGPVNNIGLVSVGHWENDKWIRVGDVYIFRMDKMAPVWWNLAVPLATGEHRFRLLIEGFFTPTAGNTWPDVTVNVLADTTIPILVETWRTARGTPGPISEGKDMYANIMVTVGAGRPLSDNKGNELPR